MGNEPIFSDGKVAGRLTSGGDMFHVKHSRGLGYIRSGLADPSRALESRSLASAAL
jgi:glycine cleavage system aminomethyltransferase T